MQIGAKSDVMCLKEAYLQKKIIDRINELNTLFIIKAKVIKQNGTCYGTSGIPDLLCLFAFFSHGVWKPVTVFIECKTLKGRLSQIQKYQINELKNLGITVWVVNDYKKFLLTLDEFIVENTNTK